MAEPKKNEVIEEVAEKEEHKSERFDDAIDFIMKNKTDTIIYVLLFVGVLTFVFNEIYGGIIVGVITGLYFAEDLIASIGDINRYIDTEGIFRSFVLGSSLLCVLIAAPFLFMGMAAATGLFYIATTLSHAGRKK